MSRASGRAKYDAWSDLSGTSAEDARARYVEVVQGLINAEA
jgi:acyl-CoA-binding protein